MVIRYSFIFPQDKCPVRYSFIVPQDKCPLLLPAAGDHHFRAMMMSRPACI
jgi:hypothetical protein